MEEFKKPYPIIKSYTPAAMLFKKLEETLFSPPTSPLQAEKNKTSTDQKRIKLK